MNGSVGRKVLIQAVLDRLRGKEPVPTRPETPVPAPQPTVVRSFEQFNEGVERVTPLEDT